tara:strand:+ start:687 stop:1010 length:324 start_codon:yes stop_codon:yes gene_type:complete
MGFQRSVLMIATAIFLGMLVVMALLIKNSYKNQVFPPEIPKCPDYWNVTPASLCKANDHNKGNFSSGYVVEENADMYKEGTLGRIKKCEWAKQSGVIWDGITNRNLC